MGIPRFLRDFNLHSFNRTGPLACLLPFALTVCTISPIHTSVNMRFFTTVATFGLAALALAQDSTSESAASSATSASASSSASLTPEQLCLADCSETDICCQAACVNVPCPNEQAVNETTACAGACTQGNGTEEETAAYASCQASCISASFFPVSTGASGSNTASGSEATTTGSETGVGGSEASATGSESESGTASGTGSSASSTSSDSGASIRTAVSGAGLFGLIIAGLAL